MVSASLKKSTTLLLLLISGTLLRQWFVVLPNSLKWLQEEISAEEANLLNGKIQERIVENDTIRLQLNSVDFIKSEQKQLLPEAILGFPENIRRISSFYRGRKLQVIGSLGHVSIKKLS